MKTYTIIRLNPQLADRPVRAYVSQSDHTIDNYSYPLLHLVYHSPDGFEFGYGGSGPSDLARSIVGDLLDTPAPSASDYQAVKMALVAPLRGDGPHEITEDQIRWVLDN